MSKEEIIKLLQKLTGHKLIEVVLRGNSAINSALNLVSKDKTVLIPEEGGWIHYQKAPKKLELKHLEVKCVDAKIDLVDLKQKLFENKCGAFLYQNPGGYFAEQPMKEIYELCKKNGCLVILDVSGSIGTSLCDGKYADVIIGSFGEWKLVEAKGGGFISCQDKSVFDRLELQPLNDISQLQTILEHLNKLPERIKFLSEKRKKILSDLKEFEVVHPKDIGFVVVVKYENDEQKSELISYCKENQLPYTECPRYIRLNSKAISIEVKQLS